MRYSFSRRPSSFSRWQEKPCSPSSYEIQQGWQEDLVRFKPLVHSRFLSRNADRILLCRVTIGLLLSLPSPLLEPPFPDHKYEWE